MKQASQGASRRPANIPRKPEWLKVALGGGHTYAGVSELLHQQGLHTICASGRCPNQGECWANGTASFMILGNICTRACRFCATQTGIPLPPDINEPTRLAHSIQRMNLRHVVVTSVDRDDLPDGGAQHWADVVEAIREANPTTTVEVLLPDFLAKPGALELVLATRPELVAHNLETVERLSPEVRSRARYDYSLSVLERIASAGLVPKSGLMLGIGEEKNEILATMDDLRAVGCQVLTLGQYLQPRRENLNVVRYLTPEEFDELGDIARAKGFRYVESGPLVRSSFHAERALLACGIMPKTLSHATH